MSKQEIYDTYMDQGGPDYMVSFRTGIHILPTRLPVRRDLPHLMFLNVNSSPNE